MEAVDGALALLGLAARDPLVSVVTPCLNAGARLQRCLNSMKAQTYTRIEHIVVDGGSTDGTVEMLKNDAGVKWISEPDSGQSAAINKGLRMSSGEVFTWLNADDELFPDAIGQAVTEMQRKGAQWVYGNVQIMENERVKRIANPSKRPRYDLLILGRGGILQPGTLIQRTALEAVGGLDESFHLAMDFDLWVRLLDAGIPFTYVPETLAVFEIHDHSKTGSVPLADFYLEEARAFSKAGYGELADIAVGRAAAMRAFEDRLFSPHTVTQEAMHLADLHHGNDAKGRRRIMAAARSEAALLELHHSFRGIRYLLSLHPWTVPQTRKWLFGGFKKVALQDPFTLLGSGDGIAEVQSVWKDSP